MADISDQASEIEELQRNSALQNTRQIFVPYPPLIVVSVASR